jgi:hypothetical protein
MYISVLVDQTLHVPNPKGTHCLNHQFQPEGKKIEYSLLIPTLSNRRDRRLEAEMVSRSCHWRVLASADSE